MWQKCRHCLAHPGEDPRREDNTCQHCKGNGGREVPDGTPLNPKRGPKK